ncbi:MAG TPA: ABC transporter ATP-binding protein [Thermoanaerobaculia bacterium]|nr:ABC transporter ATP-binding protein [Thermoanaerobaculia bacterium]
MSDAEHIVFNDVSKFYGEVLGVNRVTLRLGPGITALVGPNGSGKTTIMNLMTGLLRPTRGTISVLGTPPDRPVELFGKLGYCAAVDGFPRGVTGLQFVVGTLRLHGHDEAAARALAWEALERVQLTDAARRRVAGYSKGMRQRVRLAQAMAHKPRVLVLDEPLNGLDPMARAELIGLFQELSGEGRFLVVSSHILHEVDLIAEQVVLVNQGYVVAKGDIPEVREEMVEHPLQVIVRCPHPSALAARLFEQDHVVEVKLHEDRAGLHVKTRDPDRFFLLLNRLVSGGEVALETVAPADDDVLAVYQYLIGPQERHL